MSGGLTGSLVAFRHAYGEVVPPDKITQEALEGDDRHLQRLVCLKAEERADAHDLWKYLQDLRYTKIQGSLLAYALPFCLDLWREDLRGVAGYGGFVEHLYPVLANCNIFKDHLTRKQSAAVSEFMQGAILQEIEDQRGLSYRGSKARPYRWIGALNTYGVFRPDIERLWTAWWSLETVGRAVGALQYISCLMYPINENPVFAPWTSDNGGGPPCLWEFEGHLYSNRWLETNHFFERNPKRKNSQ